MVEFLKMSFRKNLLYCSQRHNTSHSYICYQHCNAVSTFILDDRFPSRVTQAGRYSHPRCIVRRTDFNSSKNGSQHSAKNSKNLEIRLSDLEATVQSTVQHCSQETQDLLIVSSASKTNGLLFNLTLNR